MLCKGRVAINNYAAPPQYPGFKPVIANQRLFPYEYFSGADVTLFVGDKHIADISAISYQISEQILPIYGYASRTFDAMSRGSRIASGQLMVPYTGPEGLLRRIEDIEIRPLDPFQDYTPNMYSMAREQAVKWAEALQEKYWGSAKPDVQQDTFFPTKPITIYIRFANDPRRDRVLVDVYLQSLGSAIDPSGEAVMEAYAFQAKDIRKTFARMLT